MNEKVLFEIKRINQLMGVATINEVNFPIGGFSRVGLKEAIVVLKNSVDNFVSLTKRGYMSADELKAKLKQNLDEFKELLDPKTYERLQSKLDEMISLKEIEKNVDNVLINLKAQLDEVQKILDNAEITKRNIDIDLVKFEKRVTKRFTEWLDNYTNGEGKTKLIGTSSKALDEVDIDGGTIGDQIIKNHNNPEAVDDFLDNTVKNHDEAYKKRIDNDKKLLDESKTELKNLIDDTQNVRIENLKQKIRENPKYKKKFKNDYDAEYQRALKKKKESRTGSEQKYLEDYHEYKYGDKTKNMTPEELDDYIKNIDDLYENSKKSSSIEFSVKTGSKILGIRIPGLLRLLGPEWAQYLKMLVENLFGLRKNTDDWVKESDKTASIIVDELENLNIQTEADFAKYKGSINDKMKQLKNEMQMSVSD